VKGEPAAEVMRIAWPLAPAVNVQSVMFASVVNGSNNEPPSTNVAAWMFTPERVAVEAETLPEFRMICLGLPDQQTAINRVFSNTDDALIVEMRRLIGTYNMTHQSAQVIANLAASVFPEALSLLTQIKVNAAHEEYLKLEQRKAT